MNFGRALRSSVSIRKCMALAESVMKINGDDEPSRVHRCVTTVAHDSAHKVQAN